MRLENTYQVNACSHDPMGPYCLKFPFYIFDGPHLSKWLAENITFKDSGSRLRISTDDRYRNSYYPEFCIFFETLDQAAYFKLHWAGKRSFSD